MILDTGFFMGKGFLMMCAGAAAFLTGLILTIVSAATASKRKKKLEEYLKERY